MTEITDRDVVQAMIHRGGSFVRALGYAFTVADTSNFARLKAAFPEYWENYTRHAEQLRDHDGTV